MISAVQIREIVRQYEKHGWTLRRVLLSPATRESLADALETVFGETPIHSVEIDALWFSRLSAGGEAWELRRLSGSPFALVKVFDDKDDEAVRDQARHQIEKQMISAER